MSQQAELSQEESLCEADSICGAHSKARRPSFAKAAILPTSDANIANAHSCRRMKRRTPAAADATRQEVQALVSCPPDEAAPAPRVVDRRTPIRSPLAHPPQEVPYSRTIRVRSPRPPPARRVLAPQFPRLPRQSARGARPQARLCLAADGRRVLHGVLDLRAVDLEHVQGMPEKPNASVGVPGLGPVLWNMRVSGRLCWYGNGRP